jgi:hypothetical protein
MSRLCDWPLANKGKKASVARSVGTSLVFTGVCPCLEKQQNWNDRSNRDKLQNSRYFILYRYSYFDWLYCYSMCRKKHLVELVERTYEARTTRSFLWLVGTDMAISGSPVVKTISFYNRPCHRPTGLKPFRIMFIDQMTFPRGDDRAG